MKNSGFLGLLFLMQACAVAHPCLEGGDIQFGPAIKGNRTCEQQRGQDGKYLNHGKYIQWHPNGAVAVEGNFKDGHKEGIWMQYNEGGKKIKEVFFEKDIETSRGGEKKKQDSASESSSQ